MKTLIRGIRNAATNFGKRDPTLFVSIFALWSGLNGVSLCATENAFTRTPLYQVAQELGLWDNLVGAGMIANAVALVWGLGERPPRIRASIAMITGVLWSFWSVVLFMGGLKAGLYSSSAMWTLAVALGMMRVSGGYAIPEADPER